MVISLQNNKENSQSQQTDFAKPRGPTLNYHGLKGIMS